MNANVDSAIHSQSVIRIKVEVVFGSPGMGCKGAGVCMVLPASDAVLDWECPHATALISLYERGLRFYFIKKLLSDEYLNRYFGGGQFEIKEGYTLPFYLSTRLGITRPFALQTGVYPVWETPMYLVIDF